MNSLLMSMYIKKSKYIDLENVNLTSIKGYEEALQFILGFISNILFLATSTLNSPIVSCIAIISLFRFHLINYLGQIH